MVSLFDRKRDRLGEPPVAERVLLKRSVFEAGLSRKLDDRARSPAGEVTPNVGCLAQPRVGIQTRLRPLSTNQRFK